MFSIDAGLILSLHAKLQSFHFIFDFWFGSIQFVHINIVQFFSDTLFKSELKNRENSQGKTSFFRCVSPSANHGKMWSSHKKIAGKLRFSGLWTIKAATLSFFPGVPHCKPYFPSGNFHMAMFPLASRREKISLHIKNAAIMIQDDRGKLGQPEKLNYSILKVWKYQQAVDSIFYDPWNFLQLLFGCTHFGSWGAKVLPGFWALMPTSGCTAHGKLFWQSALALIWTPCTKEDHFPD